MTQQISVFTERSAFTPRADDIGYGLTLGHNEFVSLNDYIGAMRREAGSNAACIKELLERCPARILRGLHLRADKFGNLILWAPYTLDLVRLMRPAILHGSYHPMKGLLLYACMRYELQRDYGYNPIRLDWLNVCVSWGFPRMPVKVIEANPQCAMGLPSLAAVYTHDWSLASTSLRYVMSRGWLTDYEFRRGGEALDQQIMMHVAEWYPKPGNGSCGVGICDANKLRCLDMTFEEGRRGAWTLLKERFNS